MTDSEQHEFLARLQSPFPLYYAKIGQWHYIMDDQTSLVEMAYWYAECSLTDPKEFTRRSRNEYDYHGIARGKTELNAWRNACQNLLNLNHE